MIYAISDIHGCYHTFQKLLDSIHFSKNDLLICLGDAIDRGKYNLPLLEFFMTTHNAILIKGNHEYFFECCMNGSLREDSWSNFGGNTTINELKTKSHEETIDYYLYVKNLPLYYEINNYILSHNGFSIDLPFAKDANGVIDVAKTIELQYAEDAYYFIISTDIHDIHQMPRLKLNKKMIIGHVPTLRFNGPKIYHTDNYIDIDCGASCNNGRLGCLCLDDMSEHYMDIEPIDVK